MVHRRQQAEDQSDAGQDPARDQRQDAGGRGPFAEVGEDVEAGDDAEDDDRRDIEREIAGREEVDQVFAGVAGAPVFFSRKSISCCTRSIGTGNTITVFRSTPISVSVCR